MYKWGLQEGLEIDVNTLLSNKELALTNMLVKETKDVEKMKDEYAYTNYQLNNEFLRVISDNSLGNCSHYIDMGKVLERLAGDLLQVSGSLITNLDNAKANW